jgi:hypothetical protein
LPEVEGWQLKGSGRGGTSILDEATVREKIKTNREKDDSLWPLE